MRNFTALRIAILLPLAFLVTSFSYGQINSFPYLEDFEQGDGGWFANGVNSSWFLDNPQGNTINFASSGELAWVTNPFGEYNNDEFSYVQSPQFDFSSITIPTIQFNIWYASEGGYDGAVLQYSIDDGSTWNTVGKFGDPNNWYNVDNIDPLSDELGVGDAWAEDSNGWLEAKQEVSALGGEPKVNFRFLFASDGGFELDGFAFDDFQIYDRPNFDVGIASLSSPISGFEVNTPQVISFELENLGINDIDLSTSSIEVTFFATKPSEDEVKLGDVILNSGLLKAGEAITATLPASYTTTEEGQYTFRASLQYDADELPSNNSLTAYAQAIPKIVVPTTGVFSSFDLSDENWFRTGESPSWERGGLDDLVVGEGGFFSGGGEESRTGGLDKPIDVLRSGSPANQIWATHITGSFNNGENSYLESPIFDMSGATNYIVSLDLNMDGYFEFGGDFQGAYDIARLEVQVDGVWAVVGDVEDDWYNVDGLDTNTEEATPEDAWGATINWQAMRWFLNLDGATDKENIRFRIHFIGTTNDSYGGVAIDNFEILPQPTIDLEVTELLGEPFVGKAGSTDFAFDAVFTNIGQSDITTVPVDLNYEIVGGGSGTTPMSILPSGSDFTANFSGITLPSVAGDYVLRIFHELSGDENVANDTLETTIRVLPIINTFPYQESFEANDGFWTASGDDSSWELGEPEGGFIDVASNGSQAWVTNLDGDYNNGENSYIYSPYFDFSALGTDNMQFVFDANYPDYNPTFTVEYSSDGNSWNDVDVNFFVSPTSDWETFIINFIPNNLSTDPIQFRFFFEAPLFPSASISDEGLGIDNIIVRKEPARDLATTKITSSLVIPANIKSPVGMEIRNFGTDELSNFNVGYSILSEGISVQNTFANAISSYGTESFAFAPDSLNLAVGVYELKVFTNLATDEFFDNDTVTEILEVLPVISTFPYAESFEAGDGFWSASGSGASWELGTPNGGNIYEASDDTQAWVTNLDGDATLSEQSYLYSPYFDISILASASDVEISFDYFFVDNGGQFANFEYTIDNGENWLTLGSSLNGSSEWFSESIIINNSEPTFSDFISNTIRFRFFYNDFGFSPSEGLGVDNFQIKELFSNDIGISEYVGDFNLAEGDDLDIEVYVRNYGVSAKDTFLVAYEIDGLSVEDTLFSFLSVGSEDYFSFSNAVSGLSAGTYELKVFTQLVGDEDASNDTITTNITVFEVIETFPYVTTFEGADDLWSEGGDNSSWGLGVPSGILINSAGDGAEAWVTNLAGNHNQIEDSYVESPIFRFNASKSYRIKFDYIAPNLYENENSEASLESIRLTELPPGGFAINSIRISLAPATDWTTAEYYFDGGELAGEALALRLLFASENGIANEGVGFDNFEIVELEDGHVYNNNNDGAGSLREAVFYASQNEVFDSLIFDISDIDITLESGIDILAKDLVIDGTGLNINFLLNSELTGENEAIRIDTSGVTLRGLSFNLEGRGNGVEVSERGRFTLLENLYIEGGSLVGLYLAGDEDAPLEDCILRNNTINQSGIAGIALEYASFNTVSNNKIGTDSTGTIGLGNQDIGLFILEQCANNIVENNIVSGNDSIGIMIQGPVNELYNNIIGLDSSKLNPLGNGYYGIYITKDGNDIGDDVDGKRNYIGGNGISQIVVDGFAGIDEGTGLPIYLGFNNIKGNYIGVGYDGSPLGGSDYGIELIGTIENGIVSNIIAHNGLGGVFVESGFMNGVQFNSIYSNNDGYSGILLDVGANNDVEAPEITDFERSTYTINGKVNSSSTTIQVFADSLGEGRFYLGDATFDPTDSTWDLTLTGADTNIVYLPSVQTFTATQSDNGNTSEFSEPLVIFPTLVRNTLSGTPAPSITYPIGSLGSAIEYANLSVGGDTISFHPNLVDSVFALSVPLPTLLDTGILIVGDIDGDCQPDIELNGINSAGATAFTIEGNNSAIYNLSITGYDSAIVIRNADSTSIVGCHIGTDKTGTVAKGNVVGISVENAFYTIIGGETSCGRNIISGNSSDGIQVKANADSTFIVGNFVGLGKNNLVMPNGGDGIDIRDNATNTVIGSVADGARSVISGNAENGVFVEEATNTYLVGNFIGTDSTGIVARANDFNGVSLQRITLRTIIGDGSSDARNVISGNLMNGILMQGDNGSADSVWVAGNFIGVDITGQTALGNNQNGILINNNGGAVAVGGLNSEYPNIISGNQIHGVSITNSTSTLVANSYIGTDSSGLADLGNAGRGIYLQNSTLNTLGLQDSDSLIIAFNGSHGIEIASGTNNDILGASIFSNAGEGIELGTGANDDIGIPTILGILPDSTIYGEAGLDTYIQLYADTDNEGRQYLGGTTTSSTGLWAVKLSNDIMAGLVNFTATQTDVSLNTSEFSAIFPIDFANASHYTVTDLSDDAETYGTLRFGLENALVGDTVLFSESLFSSVLPVEILIDNPDDSPYEVDGTKVIVGPGTDSLSISGGGVAGIFNLSSDTLSISGISLNDGDGAIDLNSNSVLLLEYMRVNDNVSSAILSDATSTVVVNYCSFEGNTGTNGGAINTGGVLEISNTTFSDNDASVNGGAIFSSGSSSLHSIVDIINSTFSGNEANNDGGGLSLNFADATVVNSTFTLNIADADKDDAGNGGGIHNNDGSTILLNTVVANNSDSSSTNIFPDLVSNSGSLNYSFIGDGTNSTSLLGSNNQVGTLINPLDAYLDTLADNGGFAKTHLPFPFSSLIDAGDNSVLVSLATDQRGEDFVRDLDGKVDIGAVENSFGTTEVTNTNNSGSGSLWEAIAIANALAGKDTITFDLAGTGPFVILLDSFALPIITDTLFIDGYSQSGATKATSVSAANLMIEVRTALVNTVIEIASDSCLVSGLAITNNQSVPSCGLRITSGEGHVIEGNSFGISLDGATISGQAGVCLDGTNTSNNLVGGVAVESRNVFANVDFGVVVDLSGTSTNNTIKGNYIGLLPDNSIAGTQATRGVLLEGGLNTAISDNIISNFAIGIASETDATGTVIQGNKIGTDRTGLLARPNGVGIDLISSGELIADNIISFNTSYGITFSDNTASAIIQGNDMVGNGDLGISLTNSNIPLANDSDDTDTGIANDGQNYPSLCVSDGGVDTVLVSATLNSVANSTYKIEIFQSDGINQGDGGVFVGDTTVVMPIGQTSIVASFSVPADSSKFFTATVTNLTNGTTSEFSPTTAVVSSDFTREIIYGDSLHVAFVGLGAANITQYEWDFDADGTTDALNVLDTGYVYDTEGSQTVSLLITAYSGCVSGGTAFITTTTPFLNPTDSTALADFFTFDNANGDPTGIPWDLSDRTFNWDSIQIRAGRARALDLTGYNIDSLNLSAFSILDKLDTLELDENALNFADLVPMVSAFNGFVTYANQAQLSEDVELFRLVGNSLVIEPISESDPDNNYQWFKDNVAVSDSVNISISFASLLASDTGTYVLEVSNPNAPNAMLYSGAVLVELSSPMKVADSLALIALYNAVGGGAPLDDMWFANGAAQNWEGLVTRIDDQDSLRVVGIDFSSLELTGFIPSEIFELEFLERLDFFNNNFSGEIPANIGNASRLTYIDFDNNNLSGAVPESIGNLSQLRTLWLARNDLTSIPSTIGNLGMLQRLFVQENQIGSIPTEINNLDSLEVLNAKDNLLNTFPDVSGLFRLVKLSLGKNQITDFASLNGGLSGLGSLEELDLSENELTELPDLSVSTLPNLNALLVSLNRLDFADLGELPHQAGIGYDVTLSPQKRLIPDTDTLVVENESVILFANVGFYPGKTSADHSFQWYKDGVELIGEISETFTISVMEADSVGQYYCQVNSNDLTGLTISGPSYNVDLLCSTAAAPTLLALTAPVICGSGVTEVRFGVENPQPTESYEWYRDGVKISGAIDDIYTATSLATFKILVKNSNDCATFSNEITTSRGTISPVTIQQVDGLLWKGVVADGNLGAFQWAIDGNELPTETDSTIQITESGSYTVSFTNQDGCITISDPVSITGEADEWLDRITSIFPNPTQGVVNIQFSEVLKGDSYVNIYNTVGVLVGTQKIARTQSVEIKLDGEPTGIYYIEIINNQAKIIKKVSKI